MDPANRQRRRFQIDASIRTRRGRAKNLGHQEQSEGIGDTFCTWSPFPF